MIVVFDNNILSLVVHPEATVPVDPATGAPVTYAKDRVEFLLDRLASLQARIVIPTPVLSEFMTYASPEYLDEIAGSQHFEIAAFDARAAVESGLTLRKHLESGIGKKAGSADSWQKVKIDRQIVAIAKVNGADVIYSTDGGLKTLATACGLKVIHVADLPIPPSDTPLLDAADDK